MYLANKVPCNFCPFTYIVNNTIFIPDGPHSVQRIAYVLTSLTFIVNIFTIWIISQSKTLRNVNGLLMINLCLSDCLWSLWNSFLILSADISGRISANMCLVQSILLPAFSGISSQTLLLLNIDRYISIIKPMKYKNLITKNRMIIAILIIGILNFFLCSLLHLYDDDLVVNPAIFVCLINMKKALAIWGIIIFNNYGIVASGLSFIYLHVFCILRKLQKVTQPENCKNKSNRKGILSLLFIVLIYYASVTPLNVVMFINISRKSPINFDYLVICFFCLYLNGILNSFVYGSTNLTFKKVLRKQWIQIRRKINPSYIDSNTQIFSISQCDSINYN